MKKIWLGILLLILAPSGIYSQSPYEKFNWKKELPYIGVGVTSLGLGVYLNSRTPFFTTDELLTLDANDINSFDRIAVSNFSQTADQVSDFFLYGSIASPFLLLGGKETRSHFGEIMILYSEAATINGGITLMTKSLFKRPRPYIFNEDVLEEFKLSKNAKTSFISGHTSITALNTFFAAKVFSDFYPDSKWKPVVWVLAVSIPAATGSLRVAAGKHYPTDVIAGYTVGAAIGFLIPHLHRNKKGKDSSFQIDMGFNSARLVWNFNNPAGQN